MNRWAALLGEVPSELQRLIARTQRISLPRSCSADERLRRLRAALCSAAVVRSVYASLDDETRAALADLRQRRGALPPVTWHSAMVSFVRCARWRATRSRVQSPNG
ncbi:hypothetical protein [Roseiflexus castenholzii]|uniref:hypothetical protein n=1 Tax=Roseiflexus castenholzii TaxID=120962 RepID=UPI003C7B40BE